MNDRRSFFKSLAMLGAAAVGCPGIFVPKFEPVRWKAIVPGKVKVIYSAPFNGSDFYGTWRFITGEGDGTGYIEVLAPIKDGEMIEQIFRGYE